MCFTYSSSFRPHNNPIIIPILQKRHSEVKPLAYSYRGYKQQNWDWNTGCLALKPTLLAILLNLSWRCLANMIRGISVLNVFGCRWQKPQLTVSRTSIFSTKQEIRKQVSTGIGAIAHQCQSQLSSVTRWLALWWALYIKSRKQEVGRGGTSLLGLFNQETKLFHGSPQQTLA